MIPKIVAGLAKVCSKEVGRDLFQHVVIEPKTAYASDTYMIVKLDYEPKHDVKEYPRMQGMGEPKEEFEQFLLHKNNVQNLAKTKAKKQTIPILFDTLGVVTEQNENKTIVCNTDLSTQNTQAAFQNVGKYPIIDSWVNGAFDDKDRAYVTITVDLMQKLFTALNDMGFKRVEMGVSKNNKKAAVTFTSKTIDDEKLTAILLPFAEK